MEKNLKILIDNCCEKKQTKTREKGKIFFKIDPHNNFQAGSGRTRKEKNYKKELTFEKKLRK